MHLHGLFPVFHIHFPGVPVAFLHFVKQFLLVSSWCSLAVAIPVFGIVEFKQFLFEEFVCLNLVIAACCQFACDDKTLSIPALSHMTVCLSV